MLVVIFTRLLPKKEDSHNVSVCVFVVSSQHSILLGIKKKKMFMRDLNKYSDI
jgi:hypothetical protein